MQLNYAASQRGSNRTTVVLGSGIVTTILTLMIVYLIDRSADVNVMGWYLNFVIPAGAALVGIAAGSGYGFASWITGVKIQRGLLLTIIVLQIGTYFAAQYVQFKSLGPLQMVGSNHILTFPEYFHLEAMNFAWIDKAGKPGAPLGMGGYFFRLLEVLGFVFGGVVAPAAMMSVPYCERCQIYMKTRDLALIPASVKMASPKKSDADAQEAFAKVQAEASKKANDELKSMSESLLAGDVGTFDDKIQEARAGRRKANALPRRANISLVSCPGCSGGHLKTTLITGHGKKIQMTPLSKTDLPATVVRSLLARSPIASRPAARQGTLA